jgi:hypothetical protein
VPRFETTRIPTRAGRGLAAQRSAQREPVSVRQLAGEDHEVGRGLRDRGHGLGATRHRADRQSAGGEFVGEETREGSILSDDQHPRHADRR